MGVQVCSNEGQRPFPSGDNYDIAKIHKQNFKKSSPQEPQGQFPLNFGQSILRFVVNMFRYFLPVYNYQERSSMSVSPYSKDIFV